MRNGTWKMMSWSAFFLLQEVTLGSLDYIVFLNLFVTLIHLYRNCLEQTVWLLALYMAVHSLHRLCAVSI